MRQTSTTVHSPRQARSKTATATDEQDGLTRGVVHGVILSMVVWTAALYLTHVLG